MTYPLEKGGTIITDEEEFRTKFCGTCKFQLVCEAWEFNTATTLYANKTTKGKLFVADDGTEGVFRCSSYEEEGYKSYEELFQNCTPEERKKLQRALNDYLVRSGSEPIPFSERE